MTTLDASLSVVDDDSEMYAEMVTEPVPALAPLTVTEGDCDPFALAENEPLPLHEAGEAQEALHTTVAVAELVFVNVNEALPDPPASNEIELCPAATSTPYVTGGV